MDDPLYSYFAMMNVDWRRLWQAAEPILSPSQLATLKVESASKEFQGLLWQFAQDEIKARRK